MQQPRESMRTVNISQRIWTWSFFLTFMRSTGSCAGGFPHASTVWFLEVSPILTVIQ